MPDEDTTTYPWYRLVQGELLEQGDIFEDFPILFPQAPVPTAGNAGPYEVGVGRAHVIVMSQSCDLRAGKVKYAVLCPVHDISVYGEINPQALSNGWKEEVRQGRYHIFHMLNQCELAKMPRELRLVDLREVYSVPLGYLRQYASGCGPRLRLLPPYREHLAQSFARFFMRVGLPIDIQSFKPPK